MSLKFIEEQKKYTTITSKKAKKLKQRGYRAEN